jgi:hypothetical protein
MLKARVTSPDITSSAARRVPPTTVAVASCIPGKMGLSSVPSPQGRPSRASTFGWLPSRFTAATYSGACTRSSSSSVAIRGGSTRSPGPETSPHASISETASSSRFGLNGWSGRKR